MGSTVADVERLAPLLEAELHRRKTGRTTGPPGRAVSAGARCGATPDSRAEGLEDSG